MRRLSGRTLACLFPLLAISGYAQNALSWDEVRERFRSSNPSLLAGQTFVEENRANETTAGLRPNPQLALTIDQWRLFQGNPYRPFGTAQTIAQVSQLIERRNKRGLRVESAQLATAISGTDLADLERQLMFTLRDAFIRILQAKSVLELTEENIRSYDRVIDISRRRFESGDLSR
jgi:cobalt-zinc-cadmium efflux system outer membrane protein